MVTQLAMICDRLILIDGKFGEGLRDLDHLPNVIGPLASDLDTTRSALAWAVAEMTRRYEQHDTESARLAVVIDEVQEFSDDPATVEMIRRIAAQGRAMRVSIILATQHPTINAFGDATIKRNASGRIALRVADAKSSEVAIGQSTPRADHLLGAGDAFAIVPGTIQRVQIAYLTRHEIAQALTAKPMLETWPTFEAEALSNPAGWPSGNEVGAALISAKRSEGRTKFVRALQAAGLPGMSPERAVKLLKLAREALEYMEDQGVSVRSFDAEDTRASRTPYAQDTA